MRKTLPFCVAAALLLLCACSKSETDPATTPPSEEGQVAKALPDSLCAGITETKTAHGADFATEWVAGDGINVFHATPGSGSYSSDGEFTIASEDIADNKFRGTFSDGFSQSSSYDWFLVYPYSNSTTSPESVSVVFEPARKQYGNGSFDHMAGEGYPLYGTVSNLSASSLPEVSMKPLVSVVELKVNNTSGSAFKVNSVSMTAEDYICGSYTLDFSSGDPVLTATKGQYKTMTLFVTDATSVASGSNVLFYFPIKPFTASGGTSLTFTVDTNIGSFTTVFSLTRDYEFQTGMIKQVSIKTGNSTSAPSVQKYSLDSQALCFYYPWYGSVAQDGQNYHWSASYTTEKGGSTAGIHSSQYYDIPACFYPQAGMYSSSDPVTIARQIKEMASCGIGVIICEKGYCKTTMNSPDEDVVLPLIFNEAAKYGMKVSVCLENYAGRTIETTRDDISEYVSTYGSHAAVWKLGGKPVFLIWDTYNTGLGASDIDQYLDNWDELLKSGGAYSIRGTDADATVITILKNQYSLDDMLTAGFDGFYTYFAVDGLTWAATTSNWSSLQSWADSNGKYFLPSIGPGYDDTRLNCWNTTCSRDRNDGQYYQDMADAAIAANVKYLAITSYNEWHEGTQIEPAVPMAVDDGATTDYGPYTYDDYSPNAPDFYLKKTASIISAWSAHMNHTRTASGTTTIADWVYDDDNL